MVRQIIHIDEEKCNGCGLCASACHEGAIDIVLGKAKLMREHFCDGLGDCLPQCPTGAITFESREAPAYDQIAVKLAQAEKQAAAPKPAATSALGQWPCQIKLVPPAAPFFRGADILIAADCTAYAYAGIHEEFMRGRVTLVGCPKLDGVNYAEKLTEICANNDVQSVTILRMEVPCCGGLEFAAKTALRQSGKPIPLRVVTVSIDGRILAD